ncbi:hypothetical protein GGTG_07713 [Gaeumannomyces tritici R3-111a-1]|uniref:Uncharacterized protein n=1 Tax=Gaeumannomyces tritici (strain R3-111a-1) TaxID=644352 RepID=J3P2G6_GAET3|nr:hypothetical protein GGTG_07713 [Gaeumannomyces tritici R3-111a-1]EJT73858.1 hypothetical protein GGTG_07713 [Gaeumannomyces tritici R3-111a-1]
MADVAPPLARELILLRAQASAGTCPARFFFFGAGEDDEACDLNGALLGDVKAAKRQTSAAEERVLVAAAALAEMCHAEFPDAQGLGE